MGHILKYNGDGYHYGCIKCDYCGKFFQDGAHLSVKGELGFTCLYIYCTSNDSVCNRLCARFKSKQIVISINIKSAYLC